MPKIKIDEVTYNTDDFSDKALQTLKSLQFVDSQIKKMHSEIETYKAAQSFHISEITNEIKDSDIKPIAD